MSPSRSDTGTDVTADPLRPGDHADTDVDTATEITQPTLGITGWLRWAWRQLTSMRTALLLLLLVAVAAMAGSMLPQRVPMGRPSRGVSPMEVSTHLPALEQLTLEPFPRWQVMTFASGLPSSSRARPVTYLWEVPWKP